VRLSELRARRWRSRAVIALVTLVLAAACMPTPISVAPQLPIMPWVPHDRLRGMDLSPKTPLNQSDYAALDLIQPGSVVLFSAQLGDGDPLRQIGVDPQLERWLEAHQDVTQIVRMWPVKGPDDPRRLALRIVRLHQAYPWITWFLIANEPDIEWAASSRTSWQPIGDWTEAVWWDVELYRLTVPSAADIKLLFPALAQGSPMDPEGIGYDALRPSIELYLDHGDGIAGHEYWDRGEVYLVEDRWPAWLQARLSSVPFFVTEAGRRPLTSNGQPDAALGRELVDFARRTRATVVAPFILSSYAGQFDQFDFVEGTGDIRPQTLVWAKDGP
jgi:hypothetical protein